MYPIKKRSLSYCQGTKRYPRDSCNAKTTNKLTCHCKYPQCGGCQKQITLLLAALLIQLLLRCSSICVSSHNTTLSEPHTRCSVPSCSLEWNRRDKQTNKQTDFCFLSWVEAGNDAVEDTLKISWNVLTGANQDGSQDAHHLAPIPDIVGHGLMAAHAMTNGNIRFHEYAIQYFLHQ